MYIISLLYELFALKCIIGYGPFPCSERNFLAALLLKPTAKMKQRASRAVWAAHWPGRHGWFTSMQLVMDIHGGSSLTLLSKETCFLSNLFLLSLLLNEVMQLFIHTRSMGFLSFDGELNYFGEAFAVCYCFHIFFSSYLVFLFISYNCFIQLQVYF